MQRISSPYDAPLSNDAASAAPPAQHSARRWLKPGVLWGLGVAAFLATVALQTWLIAPPDRPTPLVRLVVGAVGFGSSAALTVWAMVMSAARLFRGPAGSADRPDLLRLVLAVLVSLGSLLMLAFGAIIALLSTYGVSRGRQLRRLGRVLLPPVGEGQAWASSAFAIEEVASAPAGLGRQWRENGRTEHASVASFARLTLDLMALGAPPALVLAANQDALDEIRHTEACFGLARAIDGRAESPGAFPEAQTAHTLPRTRALALATLAVTSLIDGALHEGVSARIIAKLSRRCAQPSIAAVLKQIAADEGRHAAHGWDVVEWCLEQGGRAVADALRGAVHALPLDLHSDLPAAAADGAWERWGIHGRQLEQEEYVATRAHVVARTQTLVERSAETPRAA